MNRILKFFMRPERKDIAMIRQDTQTVIDGILALQKKLSTALQANLPLQTQVADLTQQLATMTQDRDRLQADLATTQTSLTEAMSQVNQDHVDEADGLEALQTALGAPAEPAQDDQTVDMQNGSGSTGNAFLDASQGAGLG